MGDGMKIKGRPDRPPTHQELTRPRVVVTMASWRLYLPEHIQRTVESLISAELVPDLIYVFVPHSARLFNVTAIEVEPGLYAFRDRVNAQAGREVMVVLRSDDYGASTKLVPVLRLETDPYTLIVTVDDDCSYPHDFLARFVAAAATRDDVAFHFVGANFTTQQGASLVVPQWVQFGSGADGNCYRRWFWDADVMEQSLAHAPKGCFAHDDVWLAGNLWRRGIPRFSLDCRNCMTHHLHAMSSYGSSISQMPSQGADRRACAQLFNYLRPLHARPLPYVLTPPSPEAIEPVYEEPMGLDPMA
jgi:hypothetical protein